MKPIYKYLIALALGVILSALVINCNREEPSVTVVTKTDTIVKTTVDSSQIKYLQEELKKAKAEVKTVTIKVPVPAEDGEQVDSVEVTTKKYTGKEELDNGTIDYEIYADSLYAVKFDLTTKDTIINNTTTITKVLPPKSRLFITGGIEGSSNSPLVPQAASVGLMYNRKQKWGVGLELRQDFTGILPSDKSTTVGVKVHIGL